jgi:hypothetical protein
MKQLLAISLFLLFPWAARAQNFLGHNKEELLLSYPQCTTTSNYAQMVVLNCAGRRSVYYFSGLHDLCDLYAWETDVQSATDTLNHIQKQGFKLLETRYVEPFLISKHNNHQKYPSRVYTNGKIEYCFMPISLTGRTAELNAIVVRYKK